MITHESQNVVSSSIALLREDAWKLHHRENVQRLLSWRGGSLSSRKGIWVSCWWSESERMKDEVGVDLLLTSHSFIFSRTWCSSLSCLKHTWHNFQEMRERWRSLSHEVSWATSKTWSACSATQVTLVSRKEMSHSFDGKHSVLWEKNI